MILLIILTLVIAFLIIILLGVGGIFVSIFGDLLAAIIVIYLIVKIIKKIKHRNDKQ